MPRASGESESNAVADQILLAHVVTLDARSSEGEALAIRGDRILRVDTRDEVLPLRGPATQVTDLHGTTIIPEFNDTQR